MKNDKDNETIALEKISNILLDKKKENLKYNKQEIPEGLKYNSDEDDSSNSKDNNENKNKINNNNLKENNDSKEKELNEKNEEIKDKIIEEDKKSYKSLLLKKLINSEDDEDYEDKNQKKEIIKENKEDNKNMKEENIEQNEILDKENIDDKKELNENKERYTSKTYLRQIEISKFSEDKREKEKNNILELLSLIKNKMYEKEKLDKKKEIFKEDMLKRAKSEKDDKPKNITNKLENQKEAVNQINQIIYNRKRNNLKFKSVNIKSFNDSIDKDKDKESPENKNINNIHEYIQNKSMNIIPEQKIMKKNKIINLQKKLNYYGSSKILYNNNKKKQIQSRKSLGKINENKKIINNYYFSNSNYNFNNFFQNNLSPKSQNKIYKKKNLILKENNIETSNNYINNYSNYNNTNDNSSENNYKTNIETYVSSHNYTSMNSNSNRKGSKNKNKINLKVNKKSFYINTNNFELENISFRSNKTNIQNYNNKKSKCFNLKNKTYKNKKALKLDQIYTQKRNYIKKDIYKTYNNIIKNNNNIEIYNEQKNNIKKNKEWNIFKIEDLLILDEKFLTLINYIKTNKEIYKQSFDTFNYFFNSSLYKKLENIFLKENSTNIIKLTIKYILLSLIILYEYSFHKNILNHTKNELNEILEINNNNISLLKIQIINDIIKNNYNTNNNSWIKYLLKDINNISINLNEDNTFLLISYIEQNNQKIYYKLYNLLNYFSFTENNNKIKNILLQLKTKSYDDINNLMKINILKIDNIEGSLIASLFLRNNSIFSPINPPYIKVPLISKKYTLVLDLDETLVNFKIKSGKEGYVRLRPFLLGFLEEVSQYYELIIFTSATEAYANSVIEAIEKEKKYFDFIFYRQHTIIIGNDFVKDLTRIGRPLNSTIIIDNTPQNFRFQKENGICVKPFWGQDTNDKTLYNLIPILIDIAKMGGDIRINLNKFKEEIVSKITSNIN